MKKDKDNILDDDDIRELVTARLSVLSSDTMISVGSEGTFSRDDLIKSVEAKDKIGIKIAQIELEWIRSFKQK